MKILLVAEVCYLAVLVLAIATLALSYSSNFLQVGRVLLAAGGGLLGVGAIAHLAYWYTRPRSTARFKGDEIESTGTGA